MWIGAAVAEDRARSALELAQRYNCAPPPPPKKKTPAREKGERFDAVNVFKYMKFARH